MTSLTAQDAGLGARLVAANVTVVPGEMVAIVGANGSGKSTLLKLLAGQLPPERGTILLGDRPVHRWSPIDRARVLAYLPQQSEVAWPIRVADMVALGRFAFGGPLVGNARSDDAIVAAALAEVGIAGFADRSTATLSGGELALAALARVLVTEAPLLLLDEPTAALDPRRQLMVMRLLRQVVSQGTGVVMVLHDLNLAAQFADRILWLSEGRLVAESRADVTAFEQYVPAVFGVQPVIGLGPDRRITSLAIESGDMVEEPAVSGGHPVA